MLRWTFEIRIAERRCAGMAELIHGLFSLIDSLWVIDD
jgi:hypothetical protein